MKLSLNTDFTQLPRAGRIRRADDAGGIAVSGRISLAHDERHLRRRVLETGDGVKILIDLAEPTALDNGDLIELDDGRFVVVEAAEEEVLAIRPRDPVHLAELAWHIGNRHLAAEISADRILILHDHVIEAMLRGLGASVETTVSPFRPLRGAYSGQGHGHGHHGHAHDDHGAGEADAHGRMPGDPHYGHNHA